MDISAQTQVFFFISSVGFILLWILTAVFLYYLIRFMASSARIMERVEEDMENVSEATKEMILDIKDNAVFRFFFGKKRKRRHNTPNDTGK